MKASSSQQFHEVIIIGSGLSGLGCATRLQEHGVEFCIIGDHLGGRVATSPNGQVNYGAYYITKDCTTLLPFLSQKTPMHFRDFHYHRDHRHYHLFSPKVLKHALALFRLWRDLREFRTHFLSMRRRASHESRESLVESDLVLRKYYHQTAKDYIREQGLEALVSEFLEEPLWASFFVDPRAVPTFVFLQCLLPMIVPSYSFVLNFSNIVAPFRHNLIQDHIIAFQRLDDGFKLTSQHGTDYFCRRVVFATPMTVTNTFLPPQPIKGSIECSFMHIHGSIKSEYDAPGFTVFPVKDHTVISREQDGSYLYFYTGPQSIATYFSRWSVIQQASWTPALFLLGDSYVTLSPEPHIFLATDHDVASTEDAFLNGMYTAKLVLDDMGIPVKD